MPKMWKKIYSRIRLFISKLHNSFTLSYRSQILKHTSKTYRWTNTRFSRVSFTSLAPWLLACRPTAWPRGWAAWAACSVSLKSLAHTILWKKVVIPLGQTLLWWVILFIPNIYDLSIHISFSSFESIIEGQHLYSVQKGQLWTWITFVSKLLIPFFILTVGSCWVKLWTFVGVINIFALPSICNISNNK